MGLPVNDGTSIAIIYVWVPYRDSSLQEISPYLWYGGYKRPPPPYIYDNPPYGFYVLVLVTCGHRSTWGHPHAPSIDFFLNHKRASFLRRSSTPLLHSTSAVLVLLARNLVLSLFPSYVVLSLSYYSYYSPTTTLFYASTYQGAPTTSTATYAIRKITFIPLLNKYT
jgi:hypothetical protein